MNSDTVTMIAGLCCLLLLVAFFLFRPQFFGLVNRLAKFELRNSENQHRPTTKDIAPRETKPWPWHKAWTIALFHPNDDTGQALVSAGNITFKRALVWVIVTSIVLQFLYSIARWMKPPSPIDLGIFFNLLRDSLLAGILTPVAIIVLTGFIHALAKLFGSRASFQNFFVIYVAFNAPILLLYTLDALVFQMVRNNFLLFVGVLLSFYIFLIVPTRAIKANYHFHWLGAFLMNCFVQVIFSISTLAVIVAFNPGIMKR